MCGKGLKQSQKQIRWYSSSQGRWEACHINRLLQLTNPVSNTLFSVLQSQLRHTWTFCHPICTLSMFYLMHDFIWHHPALCFPAHNVMLTTCISSTQSNNQTKLQSQKAIFEIIYFIFPPLTLYSVFFIPVGEWSPLIQRSQTRENWFFLYYF